MRYSFTLFNSDCLVGLLKGFKNNKENIFLTYKTIEDVERTTIDSDVTKNFKRKISLPVGQEYVECSFYTQHRFKRLKSISYKKESLFKLAQRKWIFITLVFILCFIYTLIFEAHNFPIKWIWFVFVVIYIFVKFIYSIIIGGEILKQNEKDLKCAFNKMQRM